MNTPIISAIRRNRPLSFVKTDEELSPATTPEVVRRNLRSIGASAQRSMSLLRRKKKESRSGPDEIQNSPRIQRKTSGVSDFPGHHSPRKFEKRPKSMSISAPTELSPIGLGESTASFEI